MSDPPIAPRRYTFTLGRLLAVVGLLTLPLAVAHYFLYGPEWLQLIIMLALVVAIIAVGMGLVFVLFGMLVIHCFTERSILGWLVLLLIVALVIAVAFGIIGGGVDRG